MINVLQVTHRVGSHIPMINVLQVTPSVGSRIPMIDVLEVNHTVGSRMGMAGLCNRFCLKLIFFWVSLKPTLGYMQN